MSGFNDLKFKYVMGTYLIDGEIQKIILCAKCIFHKDIIGNFIEVLGGGEWHINHETKEILFYSESHDFGGLNDIYIKAIISRNTIYVNRVYGDRKFDVNEYKFFFSESYSLEDAMLNKIQIN